MVFGDNLKPGTVDPAVRRLLEHFVVTDGERHIRRRFGLGTAPERR